MNKPKDLFIETNELSIKEENNSPLKRGKRRENSFPKTPLLKTRRKLDWEKFSGFNLLN